MNEKKLTKIYKYMSPKNFRRNKDIIANEKIRLAKASAFNDPIDFDIEFELKDKKSFSDAFNWIARRSEDFDDLDKKAITEWPYLLKWRVINWYINNASEDDQNKFNYEFAPGKSTTNIVFDMYQNLYFGCFSLDVDNYLMWSHYSDGHKGICLEYEIENIESNNKFFHVVYSSQRPNIIPYTQSNPSTKNLKDHISNLFKSNLTTKSLQWSYEREVRFIVKPDSIDENGYDFYKPTKVYFGLRTLEDFDFCRQVDEWRKALDIKGIAPSKMDQFYKIVF